MMNKEIRLEDSIFIPSPCADRVHLISLSDAALSIQKLFSARVCGIHSKLRDGGCWRGLRRKEWELNLKDSRFRLTGDNRRT
jgi:hypothetical protein